MMPFRVQVATRGPCEVEVWKCESCGKEAFFADEYRKIEEEQCRSLLLWLEFVQITAVRRRAGEGSWEKQAGKLMEEYEAKCTRENYLLMRVLEAILARIPNLAVKFGGKL